MGPSWKQQAAEQLIASAQIKLRLAETHAAAIAAAAEAVARCLDRGGKVLVCGNGGSAADAQHLAGELVGRFKTNRRPYPAIALTTDTSVLTGIANDFGYEQVFSRQVEALVEAGDVVVGISTSGESENVVRALEVARRLGATTVALAGRDGGRLAPLGHHAIVVPSHDTPRVQEAHIAIIHILCDLAETALAAPLGETAART